MLTPASLQDLVAGLHFVQETFPEIDSERTAMLGASYGGYMANWIQVRGFSSFARSIDLANGGVLKGHNDQTKFKVRVDSWPCARIF